MAFTAAEKRVLGSILRDYQQQASAADPDFLATWTDMTNAQRGAVLSPLVSALKTQTQNQLGAIDAEVVAAKQRLNQLITICDSLLTKL